MAEHRIAIFLVMMTALAVGVTLTVLRYRRDAAAQVQRMHESIAAQGFAAEPCADAHGRRFLRVWGPLAHPVALKLRIANRVAGMGTSDMETGSSTFDRAYRVKTSDPDRARLILDPANQEAIRQLGKLDFRVGSHHSLLPPPYWPEPDGEPRLRDLWMIRIKGKPGKTPPGEQVADLGRRLAATVCKHCLPPSTPDRSDYETTRSEGQSL